MLLAAAAKHVLKAEADPDVCSHLQLTQHSICANTH